MRIVITGGCGYLGSNIAKRLLLAGHEILIIENFSTSVMNELEDCRIVKCDITNPKELVRCAVLKQLPKKQDMTLD